MTRLKIEELLQELGRRQTAPAPQGLAARIKHQIPDRLMGGRWGKDTIHIMVHLKISRIAAVAVIALTLVLFGSIFVGPGGSGIGWYQEIRGMARDLVSGSQERGSSLAKMYEDLASNGVDVVYYGQNANSQDPTLILMYWKLPEGDYRVVFSNGRVVRVDAEALINLQSRMIQDRDSH
jgi:hypothetical protein